MTASQIRKKTDNESFFRSHNERAQARLDETNRVIADVDDGTQPISDDIELQFYCECSDENCHLKIPLNLRVYTMQHTDRNVFIVLPGHEVLEVEQVVSHEDGYTIVKKRNLPNENVAALEETDVENVTTSN